MKTLLALTASVMFLWGCQTTQSTARDITEDEASVIEKQIQEPKQPKPELQPQVIVQNKPVLCGEADTVLNQLLIAPAKEEPVGYWVDGITKKKTLLLANLKTGSVTVLEYPIPGMACLVSTGVDVKFKLPANSSEIKSKGIPIKY